MLYVAIFLILLILEIFYFKIADRFNIIDKPNERSSHKKITLRGGGIIFYFGVLAFFIYSGFQYPYFFLGLTLISIVSFLDDVFTLSNKIRIIVQLVSMFLMFYEAQVLSEPIWIIAIALIFCVGIINAYNFMDGINGITVSNSLVVLLLLAITNSQINFVDSNLIYFSIIASFVFGIFNFRRKATAFAGDIGSVSMAFIVLFLLALLMMKTGNIIYVLFLLVYGVDSVLTIVRRIRRKENIFEAHRSHLYQFLANENKTNPLVVSGVYGIIQLVIGLMIIYVTRFSANVQLMFSAAIILIAGFTYLYLKSIIIKKHQIQ